MMTPRSSVSTRLIPTTPVVKFLKRHPQICKKKIIFTYLVYLRYELFLLNKCTFTSKTSIHAKQDIYLKNKLSFNLQTRFQIKLGKLSV